jgi:ATP-dependent RNA helicase DDX55/SPB4
MVDFDATEAAANGNSATTTASSEKNSPMADILPQLRDLVVRDRDLLEKGTKAFISYVRAYKEHHCAFIFR